MQKLRKKVNKLLKKNLGGQDDIEFMKEVTKRAKKRMTGGKKKGKKRGNPKALAPWLAHVAKVKKKLPKGTPFKTVLQLASEVWTKKSGSKKRKCKKKGKKIKKKGGKDKFFDEKKADKLFEDYFDYPPRAFIEGTGEKESDYHKYKKIADSIYYSDIRNKKLFLGDSQYFSFYIKEIYDKTNKGANFKLSDYPYNKMKKMADKAHSYGGKKYKNTVTRFPTEYDDYGEKKIEKILKKKAGKVSKKSSIRSRLYAIKGMVAKLIDEMK